MAKLSFDYAKLTAHPRFKALAKKLGPEGNALDCVCRFWNIALPKWGDGRQLVPLDDFEVDDEFQFLVETKFAEVRPDGVYARGAKDNFDWLVDYHDHDRQSRAGRASAEARKEKLGTAQPPGGKGSSGIRTESEQEPNDDRTGTEQEPNRNRTGSNASSSSSSSSSVSTPEEESRECKTLSSLKPPRARARNEPRPVIVTHSEADLSVGSEWLAFALAEMPWKATDPSWTTERFAEHLAALRRATGVSEAGLVELLRFVSKDEFWRKNACSPAGLLKKSSRNGERKIDNILVRMRTTEDRTRDTMAQWAEENS